jgi:hypothetical protein
MNWECPHCGKHDLLICPNGPDLDNPNRSQYRLVPHYEPEYICVACLSPLHHRELAVATVSMDIMDMVFEHSDVIFILDEW